MKNVLSAVVSFLAIFVILSGLVLSPILAGVSVATQKCSTGTLEENCEVCGNSFFYTNGSTQFANYVTYSGTVDYVANGTAMRNFGYGTITISGVPNGFPKPYGANPLVRDAFLYWSVLSNAYSDDLARGIFNGVPITGELLGNDTSPCWGPDYIYSFRANVAALIFPQINGDYELRGFASGLTNGSNPWEVNEVPPLLEGATLVIVYHHPTIKPNRMVMIYDGPPVTFSGVFVNTTITGFSVGKTVNLKTTFIIADGQSNIESAKNDRAWLQFPTVQFLGYTGDGRDVVDSTGTINTTTGWLHDTTTFDLTPYFARGMNTATVALKASADCLTWLAQVFSVNIN